MSKTLFLLGLPIGNMGDVSQRLNDALIQGINFYVEDTRNFIKVLNLLEIKVEGKSIQAFHEHNQERVDQIVEKHINKEDIYLASDAGSPVLSDPAFPLVRAWIRAGGRVETIPGASAVLTALEVSGLAPLPFKFHGFCARKKEAIESYFSKCEGETTHIFFESPHRIVSTVDALVRVFPESNICVVREITKKFEEHYRFSGSEWINGNISLKDKGEFVLLFQHSLETRSGLQEIEKLADTYLEKPSKKSLARLFAEIKGGKTSDYYSLV